jgi:hypothetical protein
MSNDQECSQEYVAARVAEMIRHREVVKVALAEAVEHIELIVVGYVALQLNIDKTRETAQEAVSLLADLVVKCIDYGVQDGDFVASYLLPTGPVHRAIPWLEQRGITVRPGFDGRRSSAAALEDQPKVEG